MILYIMQTVNLGPLVVVITVFLLGANSDHDNYFKTMI